MLGTVVGRRRLILMVCAALLAVPLTVASPATTATPARTTVTQDEDLVVRRSTGGTSMGDTLAYVPAAGTSGQASPYPIEMSVPEHGLITEVRVVVNGGLTHAKPDDVDMLLVGPHGQQALVMSDAGGDTDLTGSENWIITTQATAPLPDESAITNFSSYLPADYGSEADTFPAPAPALDGNSSLATFVGTDVQGTWQLFVVDDETGNAGNLDHVILDFTTTTSPYPSTLDVSGVPGTITDLDVVLDAGAYSSNADTMDLLLVGPGGQQSTLVSDAGSAINAGSVITLDDEAPQQVPGFGVISTGSYRPTNVISGFFGDNDSYPAPAPASNGSASLAAFDGTDPNGRWRLFGFSDAYDYGHEFTSWSLSIEYADTVAPTGSVVIAGDAARTSSRTVPLTLTAADASPSGGVTHVRFSNDGGNTWSALQPYASSTTWTLGAGDGDRTVTVQVADAGGNLSTPFSDSVLVDTTAPGIRTRSPGKGAIGVKPTTRVKVFFTEALDPSTVKAGTLTLRAKGSAKKVKATWGYNATKSLLVLKPARDLARRTTYVAVLAVGPEDLVGNPYDAKPASGLQPLKWSFTTR